MINNLQVKKYFFVVALSLTLLTSCKNKEMDSSNTIIKVNTVIKPFLGQKKEFEVKNIDGYKIINYNYNTYKSFGFNNYILEKSNEENEVFVSINRHFDLTDGKSQTIIPEKKEGYKIINFDYDKSNCFSYFKTVYEKSDIDQNDVIVEINKSTDSFQEEEMIEEKEEHQILSYNFDKVKDNNFETILYEKTEDDIKDTFRIIKYNNKLFGKNQKEEVPDDIEGYHLINYDYNKMNKNEYQVYVYQR